MRKLTGYVGAMVIVFALMGSILAGYALNIDGQTVTVDNYEKITDVSGLYTYSDEKSYIEYDPASNYTGYYSEYIDDKYHSTAGQTYKNLTSGTIHITGTDTQINGVSQGVNVGGAKFPFICDQFYLFQTGGNVVYYGAGSSGTTATYYDITINGNQTILKSSGGTTYTYTSTKNIVLWSQDGSYDYYMNYGTAAGITTNYAVYCTSINDILSIGQFATAPSGFNRYYQSIGNYIYPIGRTAGTFLYDNSDLYTTQTINGGIYVANCNYDKDIVIAQGNPPQLIPINGKNTAMFYPAYLLKPDISTNPGIDYEISNRTNNYPMRNNSDITVTYGGIYQIDNLNLNNNLSPDINSYLGMVIYQNPYIIQYTASGGNREVTDLTISMPLSRYVSITDQVKNYKLSDIVNLQTIPANTYEIKITAGDFTAQHARIKGLSDSNIEIDISTNTAFFNTNDWVDINGPYGSSGKALIGNLEYENKDYIVYKVNDGTVDFYNGAGAKYKTAAYNDCYVAFLDIDVYDSLANGIYYSSGDVNDGQTTSMVYNGQNYPPVGTSYNEIRLYASLNFVYYSTSTNTQYMDVGQGVSINNNDSGVNTIWSNGYENGDIQILFRGDSGQRLNSLIICGHTITIEYTSTGYFNITYYGNNTVEIGKWRNILIDFDLEHKNITAYPVKTFNSFTNVVLYDTPIYITSFNDFEPTTSITWYYQNNAYLPLKFSVYSTKVFLDTYNVVMVDPSLDITQYYTDLNGFYKLNLYNFAIYGDDITINGDTYAVTNGTITIDDETIRLKDIEIIYDSGIVELTSKTEKINYNLGAIIDYNVSMGGAWYFKTDLYRGFFSTERVYSWDQWTEFILNDGEFTVIYLGLLAVSVLIARRYCTFQLMDYLLMGLSVIISLTVQVIA